MNSRRVPFAALTALSLALAACGTPAGVPVAQSDAAPTLLQPLSLLDQKDETPQLWFVEFKERPTNKGGNGAAIAQERKLFREQARAAGVKFQERLEFERLWNGISVRIDPADLGKLKDLDGVKATFPVMSVPLPEMSFASEPEMSTAIAQTGVDVAQNELGLTGKGVKIAIMDTGLDLDHPAFAGRVVASYDFVGDAFTGANTPVPGVDNVDDCGGHGTHVAGIAAAGGAIKGVAPEASLGVYRVFGCAGSTQADIMVAAMERVLADGMDVLNMSIGASFNSWPQYPTAVAASNLVDAGVVVAASIGNSGSGGVFAAGAPGVGDKVIGVANFMNTTTTIPAFTVSPDGRKVGFQYATAAPPAPASGSLPVTVTANPLGCDAMPANSLTGQVALIQRGTCGFYVKALNAQNAGASAVVIYNNAAGPLGATVAGALPINIPVVTITQADGQLMAARVAAGPTSLTWSTETITTVNSDGNLLDVSSSNGLAADLTLKPDLGAPGGMIRSTWPLSLIPTGYNTISGTSMASPHVAGVAALVIEAKRKAGQSIRAEDMRGLLQNTAVPMRLSLAPALAVEMVHRQGAGMVNVLGAVGATASVTPSKVSLGEFETGSPKTQTLTVTNNGSAPVTYTVSHVGAAASRKGGSPATYYTPSTLLPVSNASFSATTITVPAGGSASVDMTVSVSAPETTVFGGYAVFTPQGGGTTLRVPYAGYAGDYQALPVFTSTKFLARSLGGGSYQPITGGTFTMRDGDYPYFLLHLDHFAQWIKLDVLEATTMRPVNTQFFNASTDEYLPRNSTATGFFAFGWDGQVSWSRGVSDNAVNKRKPIPNGQYVVRVTALKALGDESVAGHTETWTSPVITVNAPKK